MSAPEWVETVLAEHRLPGFTICGCGVQIGDPLATSSSWEAGNRAHQAAVVWAEFTARAQQAREDVAEEVWAVSASPGAAPTDVHRDLADAAIAALLTAMGGEGA